MCWRSNFGLHLFDFRRMLQLICLFCWKMSCVTPQLGLQPHLASKGPQRLPRGPSRGPRGLAKGPKRAPKGSEGRPRGLKGFQRCPNGTPVAFQVASWWATATATVVVVTIAATATATVVVVTIAATAATTVVAVTIAATSTATTLFCLGSRAEVIIKMLRNSGPLEW